MSSNFQKEENYRFYSEPIKELSNVVDKKGIPKKNLNHKIKDVKREIRLSINKSGISKRLPSPLLRFKEGLGKHFFRENKEILRLIPELRKELFKKKLFIDPLFESKINMGSLVYLYVHQPKDSREARFFDLYSRWLKGSSTLRVGPDLDYVTNEYNKIIKENMHHLNKINKAGILHTTLNKMEDVISKRKFINTIREGYFFKRRRMTGIPSNKKEYLCHKYFNSTSSNDFDNNTYDKKYSTSANFKHKKFIYTPRENYNNHILSSEENENCNTITNTTNDFFKTSISTTIRKRNEKGKISFQKFPFKTADHFNHKAKDLMYSKLMSGFKSIEEDKDKLDSQLSKIINSNYQKKRENFKITADMKLLSNDKDKKKPKEYKPKNMKMVGTGRKGDYSNMDLNKAGLLRISDAIMRVPNEVALIMAERLIEDYMVQREKLDIQELKVNPILEKKKRAQALKVKKKIGENNLKIKKMTACLAKRKLNFINKFGLIEQNSSAQANENE